MGGSTDLHLDAVTSLGFLGSTFLMKLSVRDIKDIADDLGRTCTDSDLFG